MNGAPMRIASAASRCDVAVAHDREVERRRVRPRLLGEPAVVGVDAASDRLAVQRVHAEAEAHGARERRAAARGHVDLRMRLLDRRRDQIDAAHRVVAPLVAEAALAQRAEQDRQRLVGAVAALAARHAERLEVALAVADADAEHRAPVREQIEDGELLGDVHGVVEREQQRLRREADLLRLAGEGGQREEGRRVVADRDRVVLRHDNEVVAEPVGGAGVLDPLLVDLGPALRRVRGALELDADADLHAASPCCRAVCQRPAGRSATWSRSGA